MGLAQFILSLFGTNEDELRAWISGFDQELENSVYWKQSQTGVAFDLERQLLNQGYTQQSEMWQTLANIRSDREAEVWKMALAYGIARPANGRLISAVEGSFDPLWTEPIHSEAASQVRVVIRALRNQPTYGREATFAALDKAIKSRRSGLILLGGPTGIGKSTVLAHWGGSLPSRNICVVQHFFNRAYEASISVHDAYGSLLTQLYRAALRTTPSRMTKPRDLIAAQLGADRPPEYPLLMILDGLDEADQAVEPFTGLGDNVFVVASVRSPLRGETIIAKPWTFVEGTQMSVHPLAATDIEKWVQAQVPQTADPTSVAQRLHEVTSGVPLELRFLLDDLSAAEPFEYDRYLRKGPAPETSYGFVDYCRRHLHHLEAALDQTHPDGPLWPDTVRRLFAVMVHACGPIPADELALILGIDAADLYNLPNAAARWLAFVPRSGVSFNSPRLATTFERVIETVPAMHSHVVQARAALLEHCRRWAQHLGRYALLHLPTHLLREKGPEHAREAIVNVAFLRARLAVNDPLVMIRQTLDDCMMLGSQNDRDPELIQMSAFWSTHESLLRAYRAGFGRTGLTEVLDQLVVDLQIAELQPAQAGAWRIRTGHPRWSSPTLQRVMTGHDGPVEGAMELPDHTLISWSLDRTLRVWAPNGTCCQVLLGHEGAVTGALAVDSDRFLSWGRDPALRLWTRDGDCKVLSGHSDWVLGALRLANGAFISWSHDATLRTWSQDGRIQDLFSGHRHSVAGALELADGRILSWGHDGALHFWSRTGHLEQIVVGHEKPVLGSFQLPDGKIISWSQDGIARLWADTGNLVAQMQAPPNTQFGFILSPNRDLVCWSFSGTLQIFDADGVLRREVRAHERWMTGVRILSDGSILSCSYDHTIRWWHPDGSLKAIFSGHTAGVRDVLMLPGEREFLTWGDDGTLRLWGTDGSRGNILYGQLGWDISGARMLSGERVLSWGRDGALRMWRTIRSGPRTKNTVLVDEVRGCQQLSDGHFWSWGRSGAVSLRHPDGSVAQQWPGRGRAIADGKIISRDRLLTRTFDGELRIWSIKPESNNIVCRDPGLQDAIELHDGRFLCWGARPELELRRAEGTLCGQLAGHTDQVLGAVELVGDHRIVSWSADGMVRLWSAHGDPIAAIHHPYGELKGIKPLQGGGWVSWGDYPRIIVWDPFGNQIRVLDGHQDGVSNVIAFSNDCLLSISLDRTLQLWRPDATAGVRMTGHDELIVGALRLSDGRFLSWSDDRTLRLWSQSGQPGPRFDGHTQWIQGAIEHPAGIFSYGLDGTLRQWTTDGRPLSMWVSPSGSGIRRVFPHANRVGLFWVATHRDVILVERMS